ncbi:hypothetical protein O181_021796 [Austropuccinia psidii MF-1]|uniref:Uncharacterized protein n=1 Tax=Austropuccinia psidii MF-1 TaxID=1389203 RepID=A0A9Q3GW38_9BASI|nr:hypothetical protein [Austropuccinia psidii MF-1]
MGVIAILTWNQVGANWPHHIFYGQLVPLGALWPFGHNTFSWPFLASGHILPSLASLANFHLTNPQAFISVFGPGGPLRLLRPVGRNHGPQSVGVLGPFWPNPMRQKGAKGGSHLVPKARWVPNHNWAHLSQFWRPTPWTQIWPKTLWTPKWP